MTYYLAKGMVKTLAVFSLLLFSSFVLSRMVPGDPAARVLTAHSGSLNADESLKRIHYEQLYRSYGLHLPLFYISVSSLAVPDSFESVPGQLFSRQLVALAQWSGQSEASYRFCRSYLPLMNEFGGVPSVEDKDAFVEQLDVFFSGHQYSNVLHIDAKSAWISLKKERGHSSWKRLVPVIAFHSDNQFHRWLFGEDASSVDGIVSGDWGVSWISGRDVWQVLRHPLALTTVMAVLVLASAFPLALLAGGWMACHQQRRRVKWLSALGVFVYALPGFWTGTLLLVFFCSPAWLNWFSPSVPVLETNSGWCLWSLSLATQAGSFALPFLVILYSSLIYLTQSAYKLMADECKKNYARTLLAKGLSIEQVVFRHALRSCFPTLLVMTLGIFPLLMGGAVVIEFLFSMPGVGSLLVSACESRDFPMIAALLFFVGLISLLSFLITACTDRWFKHVFPQTLQP